MDLKVTVTPFSIHGASKHPKKEQSPQVFTLEGLYRSQSPQRNWNNCCSLHCKSASAGDILKTSFLIRAALASWCNPNWCSQTRVQEPHSDLVCVHHHHFTSGEERPNRSEGEITPSFPLQAPAAPNLRCPTALYHHGISLYNLLWHFFPQGNITDHIPQQEFHCYSN